MLNSEETIIQFQELLNSQASESKKKNLIREAYRQIRLEELDPEERIRELALKEGRHFLMQDLIRHPFKLCIDQEKNEWVWFRQDLLELYIENPLPHSLVQKAVTIPLKNRLTSEVKRQVRKMSEVKKLLSSPITGYTAEKQLNSYIQEVLLILVSETVDQLENDFTENEKIEALKKSSNYSGVDWEEEYQNYRRLREQAALVRSQILDRIPDNPIDLYPEARLLSRHFILHIGPTNSGKTHDSLIAFTRAESGLYLAPLRLMAHEVYQETNRQGVLCNMETGEEHILLENAKHTACTIELMDTSKYYEVAVIDEAQMLSDRERGGNWTQAILGVCAHEIHICMATYAEEIVRKLIELCGDTYEVIRHHRAVPLKPDHAVFHYPDSVEKGDALIVFSKKSVLYVAAELKSRHISCSVIYGALPYDVRSNEVRKFSSGETDVVVATDAIGMGLNLPIRRIVFLETSKYDGLEKRPLLPAEIQQIAGRAGRYGIFDIGYYTSEFEADTIREDYNTQPPMIETCFLRFPKTLLSIQSPMSVLLTQWASMINPGIFYKADMKEEIALCKELEELSDNKRLIYEFCMIPFDTENHELHDIWMDLFLIAETGDDTYNILHYLSNASSYSRMNLDALEHEHKKIGLLLYYSWKYSIEEYSIALMERRRKVSDAMIELLSKQSYALRQCPVCRKKLPWNWPYRTCDACRHVQSRYASRHRRRRTS